MKKLLFVIVFMMAVMVANAEVTRTPVKVNDLNKAITANIAKDYAGFMIKEATKIDDNNSITYDVVVTKGTTSETLIYDKEGNFVKKMAQKTASSGKKEMKSPMNKSSHMK